jgi:hypothetical protein
MAGASGPTANFVGLPLLFLIVLSASAIWRVDQLSQSSPQEPVLARVGGDQWGGRLGEGGPTSTGHDAVGLAAPTEEARDVADRDGSQLLAPRLAMLCHIAICLTMAYMLVLML